MKRMRLYALDPRQPYDGQYVVAYDVNWHRPNGAYDGGKLTCTPDVDAAARFTTEQALELYRSSPDCQCHRLRADGQPNRPLTAYTLELS